VVHRATLLLVWLTVATTGVVFSEPAPSDVLLLGLIILLPVVGLVSIDRTVLALLGLWLLVAAGGFIASTQAINLPRSAIHAAVTLFLSTGSVVLAAFVARNPAAHARLMMQAYVTAAVIATLAALVGYFDLVPPLTETFTNYGRARGTFKDPNVYGAFAAPAIVFAGYFWLNGRGLWALGALAVSGLLLLGVLVSFSRGAWANVAVAVAVFGYCSFVTARHARERMRLVAVAAAAVMGAALLVVAALQIEAVSRLMQERASLEQSYDSGPEGRFGGQAKAQAIILEHPLGIGALEFGTGALEFGSRWHHEDVHNVYLSMFLNAGWVGGLGYLTIVLATLLAGLYASFRDTPFRVQAIAAFAAFAATAGEGVIIDTDHWRHFFVLAGLVWGLAVAAGRLRRPPARY
jgi:O-antigen ligase